MNAQTQTKAEALKAHRQASFKTLIHVISAALCFSVVVIMTSQGEWAKVAGVGVALVVTVAQLVQAMDAERQAHRAYIKHLSISELLERL